jgi:hypothetical protein
LTDEPRNYNSSRNNPNVKANLNSLLDMYHAEDLFKTCLTCIHFMEDETCKRAKAKPPAFIIVRGCEAYFDNQDIPF